MLITALFMSCVLGASPLVDLSPDEVKQVDSLFEAWDAAENPGCALAIVKDGELVYARGYGAADLEHEAPITADTVFRIASTSKQFTAACIHLLAQDGKLKFDDDVREWIPELSFKGEPVSLRQLLHHTGGLRSYLTLMWLGGTPDDGYYTEEEALEMLARQQGVNFAPGARYEYSNTGFFLLSIVVERASGQRLREFAKERLFVPLGMTRTHFHDDHTEIVPGRAMGYAELDGEYALNMTRLEMCGDGGLFTTVNDLTKWMVNFREPKLGGAEWLAALLEPGVLNDGEVLDYASGLVVEEWKGAQQISHGGAFVGFRAEMLHLPELGFGVVCLANLDRFRPTGLCEDIRDLLLGAAPETAPEEEPSERLVAVDVPRDALKRWEGVWREIGSAKPAVMDVTARRRSLKIKGGGVGLRFLAMSESLFVHATNGARLEFEERAGEAPQLRVLAKGVATLYERAAAFDHEDTPAYVGAYWCEELATLYQISLSEDGLLVSQRGSELGLLKPVLPERFRGPFGATLWFELGEDGPAGFELDVSGVRGLKFVRL